MWICYFSIKIWSCDLLCYIVFPLLRDTSCFNSVLFPLLLVTERILSGSIFSRMFCFWGDCTLKQALYQAPIPSHPPYNRRSQPRPHGKGGGSKVSVGPSASLIAARALTRGTAGPAPRSFLSRRSRSKRRQRGLGSIGRHAMQRTQRTWLFLDPSFGLV